MKKIINKFRGGKDDKNHQIDKSLQQGQKASQRLIKILLLGSGGSGKSTILKQIKEINNAQNKDEISPRSLSSSKSPKSGRMGSGSKSGASGRSPRGRGVLSNEQSIDSSERLGGGGIVSSTALKAISGGPDDEKQSIMASNAFNGSSGGNGDFSLQQKRGATMLQNDNETIRFGGSPPCNMDDIFKSVVSDINDLCRTYLMFKGKFGWYLEPPNNPNATNAANAANAANSNNSNHNESSTPVGANSGGSNAAKFGSALAANDGVAGDGANSNASGAMGAMGVTGAAGTESGGNERKLPTKTVSSSKLSQKSLSSQPTLTPQSSNSHDSARARRHFVEMTEDERGEKVVVTLEEFAYGMALGTINFDKTETFRFVRRNKNLSHQNSRSDVIREDRDESKSYGTSGSMMYLNGNFRGGDHTAYDITFAHLAKGIEMLWRADHFKNKVFVQRKKSQFLDNTEWFLDKIDKLASLNFEQPYQITYEDWFRVRDTTTGAVNVEFNYMHRDRKGKTNNNRTFKFDITDVGGQKAERKKWINVCVDIKVVLYVFSLSAYDQVLFEDGFTNRWSDSFDLFEEQCRYKVFKETDFMVCLNKNDLFEAKILNPDCPITRFGYYRDLVVQPEPNLLTARSGMGNHSSSGADVADGMFGLKFEVINTQASMTGDSASAIVSMSEPKDPNTSAPHEPSKTNNATNAASANNNNVANGGIFANMTLNSNNSNNGNNINNNANNNSKDKFKKIVLYTEIPKAPKQAEQKDDKPGGVYVYRNHNNVNVIGLQMNSGGGYMPLRGADDEKGADQRFAGARGRQMKRQFLGTGTKYTAKQKQLIDDIEEQFPDPAYEIECEDDLHNGNKIRQWVFNIFENRFKRANMYLQRTSGGGANGMPRRLSRDIQIFPHTTATDTTIMFDVFSRIQIATVKRMLHAAALV